MGRIGLGIVALIFALVFIGPFFGPASPTEVVGSPFDSPSRSHLLGTDVLGRDALTRFLHGGRSVVQVAFLSTFLAYAVGVTVGMASGYRRGAFDYATLGVGDLLISFPPIIFALVLLAAAGASLWTATIAIAAVNAPRIFRIVRSVTIEVSTAEFVEAAVARGERFPTILRRDILPNIWTPILADFGQRLAAAIVLFASLAFLGLGPTPPAADWGLMISENKTGILIQPWVVIVPAATIALLTIGMSLLADSSARSVGKSITSRAL